MNPPFAHPYTARPHGQIDSNGSTIAISPLRSELARCNENQRRFQQHQQHHQQQHLQQHHAFSATGLNPNIPTNPIFANSCSSTTIPRGGSISTSNSISTNNQLLLPMITTSRSVATESVASYATSYATTLDGGEQSESNPKSRSRCRRVRPRTKQKPGLTAKGEERKFVKHNYKDRSNEAPPGDCVAEEDDAVFRCYTIFAETKPASVSTSKSADKSNGNNNGNGNNNQKAAVKKLRTAPFPLKLHMMLLYISKEGHDNIATWLSHGRAFQIFDPTAFQKVILPRFFTMTRVTSFHRQLNLYGFTRITSGKDEGAYYNEYFLRGKAFLTVNIQRTKVKGTKIRAASSPDEEPNFYSMKPINSKSSNGISKREKRNRNSVSIRRKGGGYNAVTETAETDAEPSNTSNNDDDDDDDDDLSIDPDIHLSNPAKVEGKNRTQGRKKVDSPMSYTDQGPNSVSETVASTSVGDAEQCDQKDSFKSPIRRKGGGYNSVQEVRVRGHHHHHQYLPQPNVQNTNNPQFMRPAAAGAGLPAPVNGSFPSHNLQNPHATPHSIPYGFSQASHHHQQQQQSHLAPSLNNPFLQPVTTDVNEDFWKARYLETPHSVPETAPFSDHILDTMTEDICSNTGGDNDYRMELVDKFQNWENDSLEDYKPSVNDDETNLLYEKISLWEVNSG